MQERAQTRLCPVARQVLHYFGMRTMQAHSCLNSEQIDTLFISVGGQEGGLKGGWRGGGHFGPEAQKMHMTVMDVFFTPPACCHL